MFIINRLRLEIESTENDKYGFDISFSQGLNIVAGENSKGKSTICSCIYYALGMEELLGNQNDKAMGRAVKAEFDIFNGDHDETKKVSISKVYIEVVNSNGKVATIRRYINSGDRDQNNNDTKTKNVLVYESTYETISPETVSKPLFLRNRDNNENSYGFYYWLAEFIGITLPMVTNTSKKEEESVLYLQTIFPALFIEQTKGWSDFLATCPFFGIQKNREKTIEFILNLKELTISSIRDRIGKKEKDLKQNWRDVLAKISILCSEYNAKTRLVPPEILKDKSQLEESSLILHDPDDAGLESNLIQRRNKIIERLTKLRENPIKKVGENKQFLRQRFEELRTEHSEFMKKIEGFDLRLNTEKNQLETIDAYLNEIHRELVSQKGIQNVISEALLIHDVYNKCPKFNQTVSTDLMASEGVIIEKLSLDENITYLSGQKKIAEATFQSLNTIIKEKEGIRKYYLSVQRDKEEAIKHALQELIADDRDYSESDTLIRVALEREIGDLTFLEITFKDFIKELGALVDSWKELQDEKDILEGNAESDKIKLNAFETLFKDKFLFPFGYESNSRLNIFIQKNEPFRYFPVFKHSETDKNIQSIRTNSSASDFVRTIWAYSISLLLEGPNHPGVLIFDEPGQHSVKSTSLKMLFEKLAKIKDRQIIVFTSVEKVLSKEGATEDKLNIHELLAGLQKDIDYTIYQIKGENKSIAALQT